MNSNTSSSPKVDVYEIVTNRIIELLEKGTVPWQQPWIESGIPMNLISKRAYRGINLWLLLSLNYQRNLFLTWDQLKKIGGSVKKGETGHIVVFWKTVPKKEGQEESEEQKKPPLLRYYKVFNIEQCRDLPEGLVESLVAKEHGPVPECESIITEMKQCPPIKHKEQKAFYDIVEDYINMPKKKSFKSGTGYYGTLFHELVHSTGHEKRLNRKTITEMAEFGSELYSIEELVAEIGSAYLCSFACILNEGIANHVAYVNGWLGKLRGDKRFIVQASSFAQQAVDFILNQQIASIDPKEIEQPELLTED
jgi:antirestriction protein ArdC